ncbi:hypothetical protein EHP00_488 [Ecytonucleospora hepatopenaei]|uniref:Uncharacterized protein n=1 Tax=Ecytonucleospora hepatopenaei TaxID=646526 RepID=A0A1W0E478_9MICR|nr:hypothetical protein EHP00_488 [Ecytonucleospora hepatopenaei]
MFLKILSFSSLIFCDYEDQLTDSVIDQQKQKVVEFIPVFNKKFDAFLVTCKAIVKKVKDNLGLAKEFFDFDENEFREAIEVLEPYYIKEIEAIRDDFTETIKDEVFKTFETVRKGRNLKERKDIFIKERDEILDDAKEIFRDAYETIEDAFKAIKKCRKDVNAYKFAIGGKVCDVTLELLDLGEKLVHQGKEGYVLLESLFKDIIFGGKDIDYGVRKDEKHSVPTINYAPNYPKKKISKPKRLVFKEPFKFTGDDKVKVDQAFNNLKKQTINKMPEVQQRIKKNVIMKIVWISLGCLAGIILLGVVIYYIMKRRKAKPSDTVNLHNIELVKE